MPTPFDALAESIRMGRDQQNQRIEELATSTNASIDRLAAEIEKLTLNVAQTNSSISELKGLMRQTMAAIDRQSEVIAGHLKVSEQQTANIAALTALASKLLEKVA